MRWGNTASMKIEHYYRLPDHDKDIAETKDKTSGPRGVRQIYVKCPGHKGRRGLYLAWSTAARS